MTVIQSPYLDPSSQQMLRSAPQPRGALFLDRDGVINVNHGYVHTPEETEWVPGIFDVVAEAGRRGLLTIVVTNQAGIGRGYYSVAQFLAYTKWVHECFAEKGTPLLATFWCPHHAQAGMGEYRVDCECRKPKPGMLLAAIRQFNIDPALSLLIGDSDTDVAAAKAAGVRGNLLGEDAWGKDILDFLGPRL